MSGTGITAARTRQVVTSDGARIAVFEFDPPQADPDLPVVFLGMGGQAGVTIGEGIGLRPDGVRGITVVPVSGSCSL